MIGTIIILVAAIAFVYVKNTEKIGTGCDWRPPKNYNGFCMAIAGYYFNGNGCVSLGKCVNEKEWPSAEKISFKSPQECFDACVKNKNM